MSSHSIVLLAVADFLLIGRNIRNDYVAENLHDAVTSPRIPRRKMNEPVSCFRSELYYSDTEITEKQENVNEALKLICCKLEVLPWQLGVMSSVKGLLAGKMKIFMPENVVIDCSLHIDGILLPHCTSLIERITTDAKYVLLVEKDTVFKKLVQYDISKHFGTECILITVIISNRRMPSSPKSEKLI